MWSAWFYGHIFGTFSGFRKHLNKAHCDDTDPGEGPSATAEDVDSFVDDFPSPCAPSDPVLLLCQCFGYIF